MKTTLLFFVSLIFLASCAERGALVGGAGFVNPYLWRASLETLADLPLASASPKGGIILTEWVGLKSGERVKISVAILTSDLRADGIQVSVWRQKRRGQWVDAPTNRNTKLAIENLILTKARALRLGSAGIN